MSEAMISLGWDEELESEEQDFLAETDAQEVPNACSLDNPDCEACQ